MSIENEFFNNSVETKVKTSKTGKILIGVTGGLAIGLSFVCYPFVSPAFRKICLPFIPATTKQISNVFACLPNKSKIATNKTTLIDIGSGDGRLVIAAAKNGFISHGVELNPWLVLYSRLNSLRNNTHKQTKFYKTDLWKFDLSPYNYVVIFGVEQMMQQLEQKFLTELSKDAVIVACRFPLPTLTPIKTIDDGVDTVWMYRLNKKIANDS